MKLSTLTSKGCAWHGRYWYWGHRQICRITLDPTMAMGPRLTIAITHHSLTIPLPQIPFRWVRIGRWHHAPMLKLYKISSRFWHGLDGRCGWWKSGKYVG